jgi:uncharacterized phiE125 gp8 family phage protein
MGTNINTAPALEPVTLEQIKEFVQVNHSDDDNLLQIKGQAAREICERFTRRRFIDTILDLILDAFPLGEQPIDGLASPLSAVGSITYTDADGDAQTWNSANYIADTSSDPGRIAPAFGIAYPATRKIQNAATVTYTAGYGTDPTDVPAAIREAILILAKMLYTGCMIDDGNLPADVRALLGPYRVFRFT